MKNDLVGQSLGRYHILEQLGEGGMATVYKAYDTRLETDVAVKVIRTEKLTDETRDRALKRFEREAKALARLTHPNIVKVTDYGEYEGRPYLVMPYLQSGTLKQRLGKAMPWQEAARLLAPIANALQYAHELNIIHRDVKASNILITDSGQPMISDFGVAKILTVEDATELTGTGMGIGTPEYMAPEQWTGTTTPKSDQYSLGIVLYEMLTGRKPYSAETPAAVLLKQATEPLPRPGQFVRDLPEKVERILIKALSRSSESRYEDMTAFAMALESLTGGRSPSGSKARRGTHTHPGRRTWLIALGASLVVALAFLALRSFGLTEFGGNSSLFTRFENGDSGDTISSITSSGTSQPDNTQAGVAVVDSRSFSKDGMIQVYVPEGDFLMGDGSESPLASGDQKPQHRVFLDAYWIDQTEITNKMYDLCVRAGGCIEPPYTYSNTHAPYFRNPEFDNFPVVFMTWDRAHAYCAWAGRRLPTEAEWEKAARGTDGRSYPWGTGNSCLIANLSGCSQDTTDVNSHPRSASPYGALDMLGNVWEWVADWYDPGYYAAAPAANPLGPGDGTHRLLRGGSFKFESAEYGRIVFRHKNRPTAWGNDFGFRCASDAE